MDSITNINQIAHVIQLAVAPVFLLTGIAGFLTVLSTRLGRITDRARILERRVNTAAANHKESMCKELQSLWTRVRLANKAIRLCTTSALVICIVIVALFLGDASPFNLSIIIAILFILAMLSLLTGLIYFLREVNIATNTMCIGMEYVSEENTIEQT